MTKHARSVKSRKVLRRIREEEEEGGGAAEIGSRVFPFRTPPSTPASMPTVGTRRSTRVFVPKQQQRPSPIADGDSARVLRSGKRFAFSEDDGNGWLEDLKGWWGDDGKNDGWKVEKESDSMEGEVDEKKEKKLFGAVYSRKRQRSSSIDAKDRKFGIVYVRRHRKKKKHRIQTTVELREGELSVAECSKNFALKLGILEGDIWSGLECGPVLLAVVVDSAFGYSTERFERLLVSVISWMRRATFELWDLLALLLRRSIGSVFSMNGIHFLPVRHPKNGIVDRNYITGCGFCKIYSAREFSPLIAVDFSALPSYFRSLHTILILHSKSLVPPQENFLVIYSRKEHVHHDDPLEMECSSTEVTVSETPAVKRDDLPSIVDSPVPASTLKRKRSSRRNSRPRDLSSLGSNFNSFCSNLNSPSVSSSPKTDFLGSPVSVKRLDSCFEYSNALAPGSRSNSKLRKSARKKTPDEKIKELKLALTKVRLNINSACCNANLLVTDTDRCWREDGLQIMLEMSSHEEWFIAVKRGETMRLLFKPRDLRPCVVNRFTHAYMWSSDDSWKLEFCNKWDWLVFKELNTECRNRHTRDVSSLKVIPVPVVKEVSGYEEDVLPSFVRPDTYIHMMDDEVGRALAAEISLYDMDSADEEWLRHLNSSSIDVEDGCSSISEHNFEKIISTFERVAYNCPLKAFDKEKAFNLCQGLGKMDKVSAIYDYWFKKRKQKRAALVRVFQGPSSRRAQLFQKTFVRKKRSSKRPRSQSTWNHSDLAGTIDLDDLLEAQQDKLEKVEEKLQKVQEAEAAASRAADFSTQIRSRAQMLMLNADLAAYKAAMALRIAENIRVSTSSDTPELDSSILFY